ncbi:MAG: selenocysteine-specific translation elongation factor, partial [Pseudomonadota bacterium]|nr:selenocysteine-specific translation elongation factor [Pseudomonadota bacterium]
MIIGTAGHIDHGKTALVKALTGIDADRLQEEKARGITIDLGFAYKPLPSGEILGFVDVPGHEKFIHNMLAGATGIDYALLVIAGDDGPMPQTLEHLAIVDLLHLTRGSVALTKIDTITDARIDEVSAQIRAQLAGTTLAAAPLFPVSAITGAGIEALDRHLRQAAAELANTHTTSGKFRLAVDRCFTLAGIGIVVTGTVFSGQVAAGDRLVVSPAGIAVRVRGIHAQNQLAVSGRRGQRCALNLAGLQLEKNDIQRGNWIVAEAAHAPTSRLDVRLQVLASEAKALK